MRFGIGRAAARAVAVAVVTLGITPALQGHAWACSCLVGPPNGPAPSETERYQAAARTARYVYVGRIESSRHSGPALGGVNQYTVRVTETLVGPAATSRVLETSDNSGTCGVPLVVGRPILVVDDDGRGTVESCGDLTTQDRVGALAAVVRAAVAPGMPRTGGAPPAAWVLVAAGAAATVAVRRRTA